MKSSISPYGSACAYLRSSTTGLRLRVALLEQSRRINAFCSTSQHILTRTVVDADTAGNQPELERLLSEATSSKRPFDQIIVTGADRLSRDPAMLQQLEARLAAADVQLIVLEAAPTVAATLMAVEIL